MEAADKGYAEIQDRVTMLCGPYRGESGFLTDKCVIGATVPAVIVWLWQRDIHIVTVLAHFRNHGAAGGHHMSQRKPRVA